MPQDVAEIYSWIKAQTPGADGGGTVGQTPGIGAAPVSPSQTLTLPGGPSPTATPPPQARKKRDLWERARDVVMGTPETGETIIGRLAEPRGVSKAGRESVVNLPLLRFEAAADEPGIVSGVGKFASEMTTPLAVVGGGLVGGAMKNLASKTAGRLIMAGFGADMIRHAYQNVPSIREAMEKGDTGRAKELLTESALEAGAGVLGVAHGVRKPTIPGAPPARQAISPQAASAGFKWQDADEFIQRWFDDTQPMRALDRVAGAVKGIGPAQQAAREYAGHQGKVVEKEIRMENILRPLSKAGLHRDFDRYLYIETQLERASRPDLPGYKLPTGETVAGLTAERDAILSRMSPEARAMFTEKVGEYRALTDDMLREFQESGLISKEAYDAMRANNQRYAPIHHLSKLVDSPDAVPQGGRTFNVRKQGVVYSIKGDSEANDIGSTLEATLRNLHKMVPRAEQNRVAQTVADLADLPEYKDVVRRLTPNTKLREGEGAFSVYRDGVRHDYAVPTPVADLMRGASKRDAGMLVRWIGATNAAVREGATVLYLPFSATNLVRDYYTAVLRSPIGFTPADWVKGFWSSVSRDDVFREFLKSGAAQSGFFQNLSAQTLGGSIEKMTESTARRLARNIVGIPRALSTTLEITPRMAIFRKALANGMSLRDAAWLARNITVDFSRSGSEMRLVNMLVPFLNARLQGTANVLATLRDNPKRAAAVFGSMVGMPALAAYYYNTVHHPETYDKLSEYDKKNYLNIVLGDEVDKDGNPTQVVKMIKPDYFRWLGNPLEQTLEYFRTKRPTDFKEMALEFLSDMSPIAVARDGKLSLGAALAEAIPPLFTMAAELEANKDLRTGQTIRPPLSEGGERQYQYWPQMEESAVGQMLIGLGRTFNVAPADLQHILRRMGGGFGRVLTIPAETGGVFSREALVEQTGAGQLGRRFYGARGTGEQDRLRKEMEVYNGQAITDRWLRTQEVNRLYRVLDDYPVEGRIDELVRRMENGSVSREVALDAMARIESDMLGLKPEERWLMYTDPRAKAYMLVAKGWPTPGSEAASLVERYAPKGLITGAVLREAAKIQMERMGGKPPEDIASPPAPRNLASDTQAATSQQPVGKTTADRLNNPLNLRAGSGEFLEFPTPEAGWRAAIADLTAKMSGNSRYVRPQDSLRKLIATWAPAIEPGNDPDAYTEYVATRLGVSPDTKLSELLPRVKEVAQAMSEFEGWKGGPLVAARPPEDLYQYIREVANRR